MTPITAEVEAACPPEQLFAWVDDLSCYPRWLELVRRAERIAPETWSVVLSARLGPFRRSKQLTMVRTERVAARSVRFERREPDGRQHAAWVLDVLLDANDGGSRLAMTMSYGGRWWGPIVERVLGEEIASARPRLVALASSQPVD